MVLVKPQLLKYNDKARGVLNIEKVANQRTEGGVGYLRSEGKCVCYVLGMQYRYRKDRTWGTYFIN